MATFKLKDEWLREQEDWDRNGDPAFNPDASEISVLEELEEKRQLLIQIEQESEKTWRELYKEVFGEDPPDAGNLTITFITLLIVRKFGKDALGAISGFLDGFKPQDTGLFKPNGDPILEKPPVGKTIGKSLLKKQAIITILLGLASIGGAVLIAQRMRELAELERKLRRAMRWEALSIDNTTDNEIYEAQANPPEEIKKKLKENENCHLLMEIIVRGFDSNTGEKIENLHIMAEAKLQSNGLYTRTINLPINVCFGSVETTIVLFCNETPPKRTILHRSETPYRTSADCSKERGKLTSDF
ncbi:hypothetical protein [Cyclobacterium jeungdonense]|uniref:Uncharacterized protein n=1 Tax=Cyclobacterium jeungdonense TaxID=708087 RepID=A0ABT8C0L7_9BACT|nr:hypothetical protein [Cyclobacterium jeungdonense]MDN3686333.1 hypothetical protein [Cyclobacterium jeungdonense]